MNVVERANAPTPKFFKVLRTIGLALLTVSGIVITAPVTLPAVVVSFAGYVAVAGSVLSAVSQLTVVTPISSTITEEKEKTNPHDIGTNG